MRKLICASDRYWEVITDGALGISASRAVLPKSLGQELGWKDAVYLYEPVYISSVCSLMPHILWAFSMCVGCVRSWMTIEMTTKTIPSFVPEVRNKYNLSEAQEVFLSVECMFRKLSWTLECIRCLGNIPGFSAFFSRTIKWGHLRTLFFFFLNSQMDHFECLSPPETGQATNLL